MNQPAARRSKGKGVVMLVVIVSFCALSVPCVGVVAAIAIPSFIDYLKRAKAAEAGANLENLFQGANAYYMAENWGSSAGAGSNTACAVQGGRTTNVPGPGKTLLGPLGEPFDSLGFVLADPVYYQYEVVSAGGCGHGPGDALYSFRARGDLDGDGFTSLYELSVGVGADGTLERSRGIYTEDPLE